MSARSHDLLPPRSEPALHVIVLAGRWAVVAGDQVLSEHADAEHAERAALEHARARGVAALIVYDVQHNPHVMPLAHHAP